MEWGGSSVIGHRAERQPGLTQASGFDYIILHRRELPGFRPCKIMHTVGLHIVGTFHRILGCLPLKLKFKIVSLKRENQCVNSVGKMISIC